MFLLAYLVVLFRFIYLANLQHQLVDPHIYVHGLLFMIAANGIPPIVTAIAQIDDLLLIPGFPEEITLAIGYFVYYALWLYGNNYFINNVIKIPASRLKVLKRANRIVNLQIVISLVSIIVAIFAPMLVSRILFLLASQFALFTFYYFYKQIQNEQQINRSILVKARLYLVKQSVVFQIFISTTVLLGVIALLLFGIDDISTGIIELVIFGFYNIFAVSSAIFINFSFYIPNFVRKRYGLQKSRLSRVHNLQNGT